MAFTRILPSRKYEGLIDDRLKEDLKYLNSHGEDAFRTVLRRTMPEIDARVYLNIVLDIYNNSEIIEGGNDKEVVERSSPKRSLVY